MQAKYTSEESLSRDHERRLISDVLEKEVEKHTYIFFHILQPGARTLAMLPTLATSLGMFVKSALLRMQVARARLDEQNTLNQRAIKARLMGELSEEDFKSRRQLRLRRNAFRSR